MPRDERAILEELTPIFRKVFDSDHLVISEEMAAKDVPGWDSLAHMTLIVAVEERYKLRFKLKELMKFRNIGDMCRAILQAGR